MSEHINRTLQENLVTMLAHDDVNGKVIANLVDPTLFEGELRVIAERAINYWRDHKQAPKVHMDDLVADITEDPKNKRASTYRRLLVDMLQLSESVNSTYVVQQLKSFTRTQHFKAVILKAAQTLNSKQEMGVPEVEDLFNEVLKSRDLAFEPGSRLYEYEKVLAFLQTRNIEFITGIKELNDRSFVPMRAAVMLFLAPTGRGKTWFLIDIGKQALKLRKKVLHITLELSEEETMQRYYQALFAISKREEPINTTSLKIDRLGRYTDFVTEKYVPDFTFGSNYVADELAQRISHLGTRFENIIIKKFPMRSLSMSGLRAFIDNVELTEKFIPDMLILDYFGVMKTDDKNHRISLGRAFEDFKGLCDERYIAGVTAHQVSRAGAKADNVVMTQISEDWSMTNTADMVATLTSTDAEFERGLARLYVNKARSEADKYGVLLTQNYKIGQFAIDSMFLEPKYFEKMKDFETKADEEAGEDDDE